MTPEEFVEAIGTGSVVHNSGKPLILCVKSLTMSACRDETGMGLMPTAGDMFNDHLKAVQRVLQEWGEPEPICRAGLLHSIYGTQGKLCSFLSCPHRQMDPFQVRGSLSAGFQDFQLPLSRREDVKRLIGEVNMSQEVTYLFQRASMAVSGLVAVRMPVPLNIAARKTTGLPPCMLCAAQRAEFCAYCNCVMDRATLDATLAAALGTHAIKARPALGGHDIKLTDEQFQDLITVHLADWLEQVGSGLP